MWQGRGGERQRKPGVRWKRPKSKRPSPRLSPATGGVKQLRASAMAANERLNLHQTEADAALEHFLEAPDGRVPALLLGHA